MRYEPQLTAIFRNARSPQYALRVIPLTQFARVNSRRAPDFPKLRKRRIGGDESVNVRWADAKKAGSFSDGYAEYFQNMSHVISAWRQWIDMDSSQHSWVVRLP